MDKPHLLCFYVHRSSFVARDIELLSPYYTIHEFDFATRKKAALPLKFLLQAWFLLRYRRRAVASLTIIAGYVSFLPAFFDRFLGLRSVIVLGGTDSTCFPSIGYGNYSRRLMGAFTCWSLRWSSYLAPVYTTLEHTAYTYDPSGAPYQGFRHFCKQVGTPVVEIWNGFAPEDWPLRDGEPPKAHFITIIATLDSYRKFMLKGVDLIVEAARRLPEATFTIVGSTQAPRWIPPELKNITLLPPTDRQGLIALLHQHRFYLQLSLSEGFPNALCEAMLCGCIPIGSAVAAIPFIVGDTGYLLERKDPDALEKLLRSALEDTDEDTERSGEAARARVAGTFPPALRRERLRALIDARPEQLGQLSR